MSNLPNIEALQRLRQDAEQVGVAVPLDLQTPEAIKKLVEDATVAALRHLHKVIQGKVDGATPAEITAASKAIIDLRYGNKSKGLDEDSEKGVGYAIADAIRSIATEAEVNTT